MKYDYEILVVGAGSGGLTVALGLASAGKKVALIEGGPIGGDCTNFGCVPSKALIDIAKNNSPFPKGNTGGTKGRDFVSALVEVRARRKIIQDEETVEKIESHGLKIFQGYASFVDEHTLEVTPPILPLPRGGKAAVYSETQISGKKIVLATGSHAMKLDIEGVDKNDILTNETLFEQTQDIKNLVVIGGGYIGCELSESIAQLGTKVSLIQRNTRLIPQEENESSELLEEIFQEKNIDIFTESTPISAVGKNLEITSKDNKKTKIPYDKILLALGRIPNTQKLNLQKAGVRYDTKGIFVDSYNRTNKKHIFAIGDCVHGNPQFTHWANNEGRGVIRNILLPFWKKSVRNMTLPAVLYTHIEVARVGKTLQQLQKTYAPEEFVTKTLKFETNDRSKVTNDTRGFIKIHFSRISGRILGATIFGKSAGEMLPLLTNSMDNRISAYKLAKTIQPYPTKSDLIKRVCDSFVVGTLGNIKGEIQYFFKSNILQILTGILWLSIVTAFFWYKTTNNLSFEDMAVAFYTFIRGNMWGPVLYIFAYAIRPVILFPATLMTFMSGALFGFWGGFIFTWIGETMSAVFAYFLGRVFGKKLLKGQGSGIIGSIKTKVDTNPFISVLMFRFLFFPFDLTNYACGFLRVRLSGYIAATIIGIVPGMSVFILAGAAFYNTELTSLSEAISGIDTTMLLYAAGLFMATLVFAKILKKITK